MYPVLMSFVAAFASPRHDRIVHKLVEPCADQRIAAFDFMVKECHREFPIQSLNPKRKTAKLYAQRIQVNAVDTPFHNIAAQNGLETAFKMFIFRLAGKQFFANGLIRFQIRPDQLVYGFPGTVIQAVMHNNGGIQRLCQIAERCQQERTRSAGGIADLDGNDLFRLLWNPLFIRCFCIDQRTQSPHDRRNCQLRFCIESPGAFACTAPADQIPFARFHQFENQFFCFPFHGLLILDLRALGIGARLTDKSG